MISLIYRLSGTTAAQAQEYTLGAITKGMKVSHQSDENQLPESDLKELVQRSLKERVIRNVNPLIVDQAISIDHLSFNKAFQVWDRIMGISTIVRTVSSIAAVTIGVVGAWYSIKQRSPFKVVGTLVLAVAATYVNGGARKLITIATSNRSLLNIESNEWAYKIADFRKEVISKGLQAFNEQLNKLPSALAERPTIEFFTDKEIKMLLTSRAF